MDETLQKVLAAREHRWETRLSIVRKTKRSLITITLCLPVAFRTQDQYLPLFKQLCTQFRTWLAEEGIRTEFEDMLRGDDGPAFLLTAEIEAGELKKYCVMAEEQIAGGRMLDIDVMDALGNPIGRSDIGLPPRLCFLCDNPASICVAGKRHSKEEIADFVLSFIDRVIHKD